MIALIILLAELIGLFILSRSLTKGLYQMALVTTRSRPVAISFVTLILFPGTVVHELSHLFTAEILGVRTGKLSLVPSDLEGDDIKAGTVNIAQTDPIRRSLIGLSPLTWGLVVATALSYYLVQIAGTLLPMVGGTQATNWFMVVLTMVLLYGLFAVSNSMFPSSTDMNGVIAVLVTVGLFLVAGFVAGFRFSLTGQALGVTTQVVDAMVKSMGLVLAVNCITLLTVHVLLGLSSKMLKQGTKTTFRA